MTLVRTALLTGALLLAAPAAFAEDAAPTATSSRELTTIQAADYEITGSTLALREAIDIALSQSPSLALQKALTRISEIDVESVGTNWQPTITLSSSIETSTGAGYVVGSQQLSGDSTRTTATSFNVGLSASQLIYDFGASSAQRQAARAYLESTQASSAQVERDIIYAVIQNYLNAGAALEQLHVAHSALSAETTRAKQIQGYVEVGLRAPIDRANALSNLAAAEARVVEARMNYELAVIDVLNAMGIADSEALPRIEFTRFDTASLEAKSQAELVALAMEQRGDFQEQEAALRATEANIRATRTRYYPTLNAVAGVSDSLVINQSNRWNAYIGARFNWVLYGGGTVQNQMRQNQAELQRIHAQSATLEQSLHAEVRRARARIDSANTLLRTHTARVENAQTQLELAEGRYRNGLGNIVELADAQQSLIEAQYNRISAELNLSLARASLIAAVADW